MVAVRQPAEEARKFREDRGRKDCSGASPGRRVTGWAVPAFLRQEEPRPPPRILPRGGSPLRGSTSDCAPYYGGTMLNRPVNAAKGSLEDRL
jgi:hypothetical protein